MILETNMEPGTEMSPVKESLSNNEEGPQEEAASDVTSRKSRAARYETQEEPRSGQGKALSMSSACLEYKSRTAHRCDITTKCKTLQYVHE